MTSFCWHVRAGACGGVGDVGGMRCSVVIGVCCYHCL